MAGRDNGFVARHYLPLADLDPRLAEAMLDVLRSESIAAYVEPSAGRLGGYLEVHLPERPRDRLWVDRDRHERAATLLSQHAASSATPAGQPDDLPEPSSDAAPGSSSLDDAWARLMAGYDLPLDGAPRWPASEDLDDSRREPPGDADTPSLVPRRIVRRAERNPKPDDAPPTPRETPAPSGEYDPLSVLDEHFVPPDPPSPPTMRAATKWATVSIIVGFALIIAKTFAELPGAIALGVLLIVGGFATLVAGMRPDRSDDEDSNDGAVV